MDSLIIKKFDIPFEDLDVTPAKVIKFLKGKNQSLDEVSLEFLEHFFKTSKEKFEVKGGFTYIPASGFSAAKEHFILSGIEFTAMRIITAKLRKAQAAALFVVTAGKYPEEYSKKLISDGDVFGGFLIDAAASEIAEAAAEWIEKKIDRFAEENNLKTTSRYSPGYCGWSVSEQQKLFSFFPDNFCSVKLTESSLMIPIKSVSGIMGLGENVKKEEYECAICEDENCFRRNI